MGERFSSVGAVREGLDGVPMGMAWVTLEPLDGNAPPARTRTSKGEDGKFLVPPSHGIVPGPHRITVHHVSEQYPHVNTGAYTLDDAVRYDVGTRNVGDEALVIELRSHA